MGRHLAGALIALVLGLGSFQQAHAQSFLCALTDLFIGGNTDGEGGKQLRATIWVDPDGCEHWVMDDGLEGFMSSHLDRSGKPVCRGMAPQRGVCKTLDSATTFAVGSARLMPASIAELKEFLTRYSNAVKVRAAK